ncbi:DNA-directed RNA polymerase subunit beta' [Haloglycomyces albus]|uniref:DNA-directed RNA polymerase subunit beta' n=1 Tax=Haloglycomyces albus TaxID=526067 RepID=UPI00046CB62A|nr:DNA-directed RNA polymerase subunit beta' [Haloglycomyces albus]
MLDVNFFDKLKIGLATAEDIRQWSHGEVKKPETINYRTLKPEKDGLFCEKIFGPTRDWECYCGKYKRIRYKGIICERCGVEVTRSKVRRERMGHIELAAPVTHIWYFKGVPSRLGYLLDLAPKDLEKIIYFAAFVITEVDEEARQRDLPTLENEIVAEKRAMEKQRDEAIANRGSQLEADMAELESEGARADVRRKTKDAGEREMRQIRDKAQREIDRLDEVMDMFRKLEVRQLVGDDMLYRELDLRFGEYFKGGMGAEAIYSLLERLDLDAEAESLRDVIATGKGQKKLRALKRLKVVASFQATGNSPLGMVLDSVPVIPPELRPMVQLDGGRFATADLNDLYRRVINRNNRLKRLIDLGAPEIIVANEKRMLQESVDALFDNGRRGRPVTGPGNRPLKSLSDMLKGKQGRFRQNLLGKRVDYSGRSVIVVGPQLKLHQCGLPKQMALELFKPFVMKRLVDLNHAQNIKSAKRMVERARPVVWDVLEEVIAEHPVMLNRAPTLHRLGIQAFEPQLVEGKAIQLHPLVCTAFNADFDGDQMAVHVPLSAEAQAEARILMLASNNILKPSDGKPVALPTQDQIIGLYYLSHQEDEATGAGRAFASVSEAIMAYDRGELNIQAPVKIRLTELPGVDNGPAEEWQAPEDWQPGLPAVVSTTLGRVFLNDCLPPNFRFINYEIRKGQLSDVIYDLSEHYSKVELGACLDALKTYGFKWAGWSGVTIGIDDVVPPAHKEEILGRYDADAAKIDKQYNRGLMTAEERRGELTEIWTKATSEVMDDLDKTLTTDNPLWQMINSGARGNMLQLRQIAGIRGLVANPKGEIIPTPIKSSLREGLTVLEYFISTHGSRKGLADTALRTADSGYLTRRLVDVSQDVIVREEDCGTDRGQEFEIATEIDGKVIPSEINEISVDARSLATDATADGQVVLPRNSAVTNDRIAEMIAGGVKKVKVRSVLTCESRQGVCALCYGRSMPTGTKVDLGEAVGIIAAQSIGEPGTQLTMRTFHTGGVAGDDITQGLPRVAEVFEARIPKGKAPIAESSGTVRIEDAEKSRKIVITPDDGSEEVVVDKVPRRLRLRYHDGDHVTVGEKLVEGAIDPHELLRVLGPRQVQRHLVEEIQNVYRSQGVQIHDKHIEIIVRQMIKRITIIDSGTSEFLPGSLVDRLEFNEVNRSLIENGGEPASGRPQLMGITKASLATESWLSAASFQETTRVLTEAAISGKSDALMGLKENVILGKLIPAGTGLPHYRNVSVEPSAEAKAAVYSLGGYEDNAAPTFSYGGGAAVSLEDSYDLGTY